MLVIEVCKTELVVVPFLEQRNQRPFVAERNIDRIMFDPADEQNGWRNREKKQSCSQFHFAPPGPVSVTIVRPFSDRSFAACCTSSGVSFAY